MKDNKWRLGLTDFNSVMSPQVYFGNSGIFLWNVTCDPLVGDEVCLQVFDKEESQRTLLAAKPIVMHCKSGAARTRHGTVGFILFQFSQPDGSSTLYDYYVNPFDVKTMHLLTSAGQQTHLKVFFVARELDPGVIDMIEFGNVYDFGKFAAFLVEAVKNESPSENFRIARAEFMKQNSLEDLLEM